MSLAAEMVSTQRYVSGDVVPHPWPTWAEPSISRCRSVGSSGVLSSAMSASVWASVRHSTGSLSPTPRGSNPTRS